ncbi:hypothetical protein [Streptomyces sp. NPDC056527]
MPWVRASADPSAPLSAGDAQLAAAAGMAHVAAVEDWPANGLPTE